MKTVFPHRFVRTAGVVVGVVVALASCEHRPPPLKPVPPLPPGHSIDPNPRQPNNTLLSTPGPSGTMTNGPFH
jgi:hypothetical protein